MHYIGMMVVVAVISLYGSSGTEDFRRGYDAAASGEIGDAIGYATAGLRRALRDADSGHDFSNLKVDARYQPARQ